MAYLDINLNYLSENLHQIQKNITPESKVCAVLKNNAYGLGLTPTAIWLARSDVDYFAVNSLEEALVLREAGIKQPILCLGHIDPYKDISEVVRNDISVTLYDYSWAKTADYSARKWGQKIKYHLKIDTGMHRFGIYPSEVVDFLENIAHLTGLSYEGIYSHFAQSTDNEACSEQMENFQEALFKLQTAGLETKLVHICSTNSIKTANSGHFDMVRVGAGLFGHSYNLEKLKPIWELKAKIISIKRVTQGARIGYNRTYTANRSSLIAVVDLGYTDGILRSSSNHLIAYVKDKMIKNVGMLCMGYSMFDVTGISDVNVGDTISVFHSEHIDEQLERYFKATESTIYELISGFPSTLKRNYLQNNQEIKIV